MTNDNDDIINSLKEKIAATYQQREALKTAMKQGRISSAQGLRDLEPIDKKLSDLDLQFKQLWDTRFGKNQPVS